MRLLRLLLLLLSIAVAIAFALLRPLPARAVRAPVGPKPTSTEDPPLLPPVAGVATAEALAPKPRAHRRLAAARHANRSLLLGREIVRYAKHLLGAPYEYGGSSPRSGFDCSGFVRYVYSHFGISLPHSSFGDLVEGRRVGRSALRPGDLVFFDGAGHVGIYVGNGHFIHAPHTGTVVSISTMSGWYGTRYVGARRVR
jgi:cell wall-associated NlpC family hydrolase